MYPGPSGTTWAWWASNTYWDDGDDMMMALARKIVSGDEELLVDDGWKVVEVEPETVEVNGNGKHANGNGHHADGIGPTVELVPVNGRHANGNGNGHHDEAPEPVKPKGRKTQAPSLSLFEWAVEQEREEEPVGAGR